MRPRPRREDRDPRIRPSGRALGAEVSGVDLTRPLDAATIQGIRAALLEHEVLVFRDQPMSCADLSALARRFGPIYTTPRSPSPPGHPELVLLHADASTRRVPGESWHSDGSCEDRPPMGTILHLTEAPVSGGDTLFTSTSAAWRALPEALQRDLEGLEVINGNLAARWYDEGRKLAGRYRGAQPLVRLHPETGRPALFVDPTFSRRIVGWGADAAEELLGDLFRHCTAPALLFRLRWRQHTVAFWDNRCTLHRASFDYWPRTRTGVRVSIAGDPPIPAAVPGDSGSVD